MKRLFDLILSFLFIVILSPLIIILIILVSVTSKGGPFFLGVRIGKNGKPFKIIKFRSMRVNSEGNGTWNISGKDPRVTKIGYFLRKTKLDEIAQLFNILFGQMSFVGPRPELPIYISWYSSIEKPILDLKPGLTDWASIVNSDQISAFTNAEDPDFYYEHYIRPLKLKLQLFYRNKHSLLIDLKCLFWTFWKVVSRTKKNPKDVQNIVDEYFKELDEKKEIAKTIEKITIPNTDLSVSRLCFGGCPMGRYGWGETSEEELINAVRYALDVGINFFDTSDTYGLGESERILGEAIKGRRKEAIITTKFGVRRNENGETFYDNSPSWIREALEHSLKRLQTDYVDLYLVHYFDGKTPYKEIFDTLDALKQEGKIRYYGVCNVDMNRYEELKPYIGKICCMQNEYSLVTRKNEEIFKKFNQTYKTASLTWGSLGQGILTGNITKDTVFAQGDRRNRDIYVNFHGEKFEHNLMVVEEMKKIAKKYDRTCASIAIRFILDYLPDSVALVGVKRISELKQNLNTFGYKLKQDEVNHLVDVSYFPSDKN